MSANAKMVAKYLKTDHHEIVVSAQQFIDFPSGIADTHRRAACRSTCVPVYFSFKCAREHVKVVLSGEGADEVFGGYTFR